MTKIFLTGATGYIGGDALYALAHAHPEYEITALVRNSSKGAQVVQEYPSIRLVYGDLDSGELLEEEARRADVVAHFAHADHVASATAMVKGLVARTQPRPGFFIHTSGTGILLFADIRSGTYGEALNKVYNDLEGVGEVTSLPDDAPHRNVDKIVLAAGTEHADRVKTAIVCPPTIYGRGRGPGNQRSHQVPELAKTTLTRGHGVQVNAGKTLWGNIHVHDLSALYLALVENAAVGGSLTEWPGKPDLWGARGYYFCENGEDHVWGDVSRWVATAAHQQGLVAKDEVRSIDRAEADTCTPMGSALWGANSRGRALRAGAALGWKAKGASLKDEIAATVEVEGKTMGLLPGHAKKAAGEV